jgi:hypothetical protein
VSEPLPCWWIRLMRAAGLSGEEVHLAYTYHLLDHDAETCISLVKLHRALKKEEKSRGSDERSA